MNASGDKWLNEDLISFFMQLMGSVDFKEHSTKLLFVPTTVTQCIRIGMDDPRVFLDPLEAENKDLLIFPVNNNDSELPGGTHWSLLVYSKIDDAYYSFDSSSNANVPAMVRLMNVLKVALKTPFSEFIKCPTLQQANGFDCGVHVVANAEHIARFFINTGTIRGAPMLSNEVASRKRQEMLSRVRRLAGIEQEPATSAPQPNQRSSKHQNVKLQLAKAIQKLPCAQSRGKAAIKRVPWGGIKIPGHSAAELKQHLQEMLGATSKIRTFGEIMADYEQNGAQLTARVHPDFPKRPLDPVLQFSQDHHEDIIKSLGVNKILKTPQVGGTQAFL